MVSDRFRLTVVVGCSLLAQQVAAISRGKLESWVTEFETVQLDWETPLADRSNLQPLTIPISGNNVTLDLMTNGGLFASGAVGVPDGIGNDLLVGTVRGQDGDPESYVSMTVWPTGLNGRVSFEDANGKRQLVHIDKLDGTSLTVLYNDLDIVKGNSKQAKLSRRTFPSSQTKFQRRSEFWKRQNVRATAAAGKDCAVGIIADVEFTKKFGADAVKQMASIMNDVQGTFLRNFDVGLPIQIAVTDSADKIALGNNGIGSAGNISLALDQLSAASSSSSVIPSDQNRNLCVTHMFMNRQFGDTLGLGFVGTPEAGEDGGVCTGEFATGVSTDLGADGAELPQAAWVTTVTHEIGHSFGAEHDEDVGCGGQRNIMSAIVEVTGDPVNTFSTCSLDSVTAVLQSKSGCFKARA